MASVEWKLCSEILLKDNFKRLLTKAFREVLGSLQVPGIPRTPVNNTWSKNNNNFNNNNFIKVSIHSCSTN